MKLTKVLIGIFLIVAFFNMVSCEEAAKEGAAPEGEKKEKVGTVIGIDLVKTN